MSIEKLKQVELLKEERDKLSSEISARLTKQKAEIISKLVTEFTSYLKSHDFSVANSPGNILATFKGFALTLEVPSPEDSYIGTYTLFKLYESAGKRTYIVDVLPVGLTRIPEPTKQGELERLQEEIASLKAFLTSNSQPSGIELAYFVENPSNRAQASRSAKKANSFGEVIDAIVT